MPERRVGGVGPALVTTLVALVLLATALPAVLAASVERQPWPRRVRLTRAAHLVELASEGDAAVTVLEARIIHLDDSGARAHVLLSLAGGGIERLVLGAETDLADRQRLRHWQAELIPVLVIGARSVDVHGPSGRVRGERLLAVDAPLC
jgi:hypothetical protein